MAHMETLAGHRPRKGRFLRSFLEGAVTMIAAFETWRQCVANRKAIAGLTVDELRDIGHPVADVPTPTLDIKAGLITNLISMR